VTAQGNRPKLFTNQNHSHEFGSIAVDSRKCKHGQCHCTVHHGAHFCSPYCEQAAAQAVERDYCQCEHEALSREGPEFYEAQFLSA